MQVPQAEMQWKDDVIAAEKRRLENCVKVKHTFARTAREC